VSSAVIVVYVSGLLVSEADQLLAKDRQQARAIVVWAAVVMSVDAAMD
jgi:hypothetical protein